MAAVQIRGVEKNFGETHIIHGVDIDIEDGAVHRAGRPVGLRQVDAAAHDRRARGDHRRRDRASAARVVNDVPPEGARHRDGVPELRALPAHDGARQHGLRAACWRSEPKATIDERGRARRRDPRPRRPARPLSAPALRRPAPARRDGPRDRARPAGVPVRRAALQPRRQAARADAHRDQGAAPAPEDHHRSTSRTTRSRR